MAPPILPFPAADLPSRIQTTNQNRQRKDQIDLKKCDLFEMLQYECYVDEPVTKESITKCWPIERLFRRCRDRNGVFTVETTAWEGYSKVG